MTSLPRPFKCEVWELLSMHSPVAAQYFQMMFHHPIRDHYNPSLEMADVNAFWRTQLALLGPHTLRTRLSLVDDISRQSWLELFQRDVIPTIVSHWVARVQSLQ